MKAMTVKTDRNDARGMAQLMRIGFFRPVHANGLPAQDMRALLTGRRLLLGKLRDIFGIFVDPGQKPRTLRQDDKQGFDITCPITEARSLSCRSQQPTDLTRRSRFWPFSLLETHVTVAGGRFDTPNRITVRP
jgi:hypothetical protein